MHIKIWICQIRWIRQTRWIRRIHWIRRIRQIRPVRRIRQIRRVCRIRRVRQIRVGIRRIRVFKIADQDCRLDYKEKLKLIKLQESF